jgi:hypothetical protein
MDIPMTCCEKPKRICFPARTPLPEILRTRGGVDLFYGDTAKTASPPSASGDIAFNWIVSPLSLARSAANLSAS